MNRDIQELREVVQKLVPLLAGKGLTVTQRGSQAYVEANPKTLVPELVNIPNIPDNAQPDFIRAIQGFIDHEVGHVLITDWKFYGRGARGDELRKPEVQRFIQTHNVVEDTMIEKEMVKIFPGSERNISDLRKHFIDKITKKALAGARDEKEKFIYLLVPAMRALSGHPEFQEFMDAGKHWDNKWVKEMVASLKPATLDLLKKATTTKETLAIAEELHVILHPPKQPEPAPPPKQAEPPKKPEPPKQEPKKAEPEKEKEKQPEPEPSKDEDDEEEGAAPAPEEDEDDEPAAPESEDDDEEDEEPEADDDEEDEDLPPAGAGDGDEDRDHEDEGDDEDEDDGDAPAPLPEPEQEDDDDDGDEAEPEDDDETDSSGGAAGSASEDDAEDGEPGELAELDASNVTTDGADGGGIGNIDTDDEEPEGQGGLGVGAESVKSIFDFDEDAFEKADMSSQISILISEEAVLAMDASQYNVFTREMDQIEPIVVPKIEPKWVPEMEDEVRSMTGRMQKDIERLMASQSHIIRTPGHRKGKLHAPSLYRLQQNDPRVFSQREEHVSKDTAVSLVCDNSGSMHGQKMKLAMTAAYALSTTLDRVKINHEVIGFTTGGYNKVPQGMREAMQRDLDAATIRYDRAEPIIMPIYKEFGERITATVKARFAYMMFAQNGLGANVDGESLEYAAIRLMKQPEKRKVMLVLSDGQPVGSAKAGPHLSYMVKHLTKAGIEVMGIGIKSTAVQRYYPNHVVLNDITTLPTQVMQELRRILA